MINSFNSLRHNAIIRSYYKNNYIGYLGAPGTHSSKGFMARGIQKCD